MLEYFLIAYGIGFFFTFMSVKWQKYEGKRFNIINKTITGLLWPFFFVRIFLR